ncbi:MAG: helix-turn-helix domain-containing protein [Solirubrobacteraceae bacterium]
MSANRVIRVVHEPDDAASDGRLALSRLLEADDVARYIGMTTDWIYREVRAGRMPHIRLGRYVRFRLESIDAWLAARERGPATDRARSR